MINYSSLNHEWRKTSSIEIRREGLNCNIWDNKSAHSTDSITEENEEVPQRDVYPFFSSYKYGNFEVIIQNNDIPKLQISAFFKSIILNLNWEVDNDNEDNEVEGEEEDKEEEGEDEGEDGGDDVTINVGGL